MILDKESTLGGPDRENRVGTVKERLRNWNSANGVESSLTNSQYFTQASGDCTDKCVNGGICFKGDCICAKGYFGTYCEEITTHPGEYAINDKPEEEDPFNDQNQKKKPRKNNGINYLEHTPEAELPADYYLNEQEKQDLGSGNNGGFGKMFLIISNSV